MRRLEAVILQGLLVAGLLTVIFPNSSSAVPQKYFCAEYNLFPATMQNTAFGPVPLIRWISQQYLNGLSPEERCRQAANVLQVAYDNNTLQYIRAAFVDGQPVICTALNIREGCANEAVVIRLNSSTDPNVAIAELLNVRDLVSRQPLYQNGLNVLFAENGFNYVDLVEIETLLVCAEYSDHLCSSAN